MIFTQVNAAIIFETGGHFFGHLLYYQYGKAEDLPGSTHILSP